MSKKTFSPSDPYVLPEQTDIIRNSALRVLEFIIHDPTICKKVKTDIIDKMLWTLTEIKKSYKYHVRYFSNAALHLDKVNGKTVRHEHVIPRKYLTDLILTDYPAFKKLIPKIVGCCVTIEENGMLNKIQDLNGWDRYKKLGIRVYDRLKHRYLW